MPEPTIIPPTPTVTQPSRPDAPVTPPPTPAAHDSVENVQNIFDRVFPAKGDKPLSRATPEPPETPQRPPIDRTPPPPAEPEPKKQEPGLVPSFIEEALRTEKPPAASQPPAADEVEVEWAEDLPPEQKQSRIKGLRDAYKRTKEELKTLKSRPPADQAAMERLAFMEQQNKQMAEVLSRVGVEHSPEFKQQILRPLYASWGEASRIVKESGGDPQDLRAAMSLQGRAQFEALDQLFADMPESAKAEAHDALRTYRRYDQARAAALADAPRTAEAIRQRETQRQHQELGRARNEMQQMFENALTALRDEAKVEVFLKTNDPETDWWNKQGESVVEQARSLFLENTDLNKVAMACLLAPTADAYRNLFMKAQKQVAELKQIIKEKGWAEPNLSESGGNAGSRTPEAQHQHDLNRPFKDVFLEEFHRQQARSR
jgi:hypothetical protein